MRWNNRRGFVGYTPKEIRNMASSGRSVGIYRGLVYDVTNYLTYPPATRAPYGQQAPQVNVDFMDGNVLDLFKFNSGSDITKALDGLNIDPNDLPRRKYASGIFSQSARSTTVIRHNAYSRHTFCLPSRFSWSASLGSSSWRLSTSARRVRPRHTTSLSSARFHVTRKAMLPSGGPLIPLLK